MTAIIIPNSRELNPKNGPFTQGLDLLKPEKNLLCGINCSKFENTAKSQDFFNFEACILRQCGPFFWPLKVKRSLFGVELLQILGYDSHFDDFGFFNTYNIYVLCTEIMFQ